MRALVTSARRIHAALALAAYVACTLAAPLAHLARHNADHAHAALTGAIDWKQVSGTDGRIDLSRLAQAIGLPRNARHEDAHRTGTTHDHGREKNRSRPHGEGSIAHFGVALGSGVASPPTALESPRVRPTFTPNDHRDAPSLAPRFVHSQRSQAPPQA